MLKFTILCSGSKGNCSLIQSDNTSIIIDCGATATYLNDCFKQLDFDYHQADSLLITHSHSDHLKQIKMFADLPFYSPFAISSVKNNILIQPYEIFKIGDLSILPLPLSHDCDITVGFVIFDGSETLVQITDTGYVSDNNLKLIKNADYYIFESNHDIQLLMHTNRPAQLKSRILSDNGHMCNEYASEVLSNCISMKTKEIVLAHISQETNSYSLAYEVLVRTLKDKHLYRDDLKIKAVEQFEIYKNY